MKKIISIILAVAILVSGFGSAETAVAKTISDQKVTQNELDKYFSKSAFVGNSVSLALKYYTKTKGKSFMGSPKMLVYGSYSFVNDMTSYKKFMIHYKGRPMKAKDAIKAAGVKQAFICMGTNDMNTSTNLVFTHYVQYIKGIQKKNSGIVIFIESTTPVRKNEGFLNNKEIDKLNKRMKKYANAHKDIYYIDINTPMKDKTGRFRAQYCSDGFCHMTMKGCQVWLKIVSQYVKKLLQDEKDAKRAIKYVEKSLQKKDYVTAKICLGKLEDSTVKLKLKKRLNKIKKKINWNDSSKEKSEATMTPSPSPANLTPEPTGAPNVTVEPELTEASSGTVTPAPTETSPATPELTEIPIGGVTPVPTKIP